MNDETEEHQDEEDLEPDELFIDDDDEYEEDIESKSPDSVYVEDAWAKDD